MVPVYDSAQSGGGQTTRIAQTSRGKDAWLSTERGLDGCACHVHEKARRVGFAFGMRTAIANAAGRAASAKHIQNRSDTRAPFR